MRTPLSRPVPATPRLAAAARLALPLAAALTTTLAACARGEAKKADASGGETAPATTSAPARAAIPAPARAALDSGNAAFRAEQLDAAMTFYRTAADAAPKNPAPWYGIYMVALKQKNQALADSAMAAVRARSDEKVWSDTLMSQAHDGRSVGRVGMPSGHPPMTAPPAGMPASPHGPPASPHSAPAPSGKGAAAG